MKVPVHFVMISRFFFYIDLNWIIINYIVILLIIYEINNSVLPKYRGTMVSAVVQPWYASIPVDGCYYNKCHELMDTTE